MIAPRVQYRQYQCNALSSYVTEDPTLSPPNLFLQGGIATGKSHVLSQFFEENPGIIHASLRPIELVTWKPLIQAISRIVQSTLLEKFPEVNFTPLDPLQVEEHYHLINHLNEVFAYFPEEVNGITFHLVLDGFDALQDLDATLLSKFLKLNELITSGNLKIIYVLQDNSLLERYSSFIVPTIIFPCYKLDQILDILQLSRYDDLSQYLTHDSEKLGDLTTNQLQNIVSNFITLILQSFNSYTGNNLMALNDLIDLKWAQYVQLMTRENIFKPVTLYKSAIHLFISTDDTFSADTEISTIETDSSSNNTYELSTISKFLLISSYFCSYLEPRYDSSIFSRKSHIKTGRTSYGRRKKKETNPRNLQPSMFTVERLLAIFQSIFPYETQHSGGSLAGLLQEPYIRSNIEVFQNVAELHTLKLIATTATKNIDFLNYKVKWKVNVPWEIIEEISKSVDFDISQFFSDISDN